MEEEVKAKYGERYDEIVRIIKSFESLEKSEEWKTLKELVFSKSLIAIERQLLNESLSKEVKVEKIYRLQGEWAWAKQYNDVARFVETLKKQLSDIKDKIS